MFDWKLWIIRVCKYGSTALVIVYIILSFIFYTRSFKDFVIIFYFILFELMMIMSLNEFLVNKLSIITRYFQFLQYNFGFGIFLVFLGLFSFVTPITSGINAIPVVLAILGALLAIFGCIYLNHITATPENRKGNTSPPANKDSKPETTSLKPPKDPSPPKTKPADQPASTSTPGQNKIPPPVF